MNSFYLDSKAKLEDELRTIRNTTPDNLICYEKSANKVIQFYNRIKEFLKQNPFETKESEIQFFKYLQPHFISTAHYYTLLYNHQNKKNCISSSKELKLSCKRSLKQISRYNTEYQHIIIYYKSGKCNLDEKYFLRQSSDYPFVLEECIALVDKEFSTGYDLIIARYLAYEKYAFFLQNELNLNEFGSKTTTLGEGGCFSQTLQWTGSKIELIELMYALQSKGSINNSQIKIKELAAMFEKIFQVDFGDYFHTFSEIKNRRNPTLFIDNLRKALMNKIEEKDF
jgi:hypothetical protein